MDKNHSIISIIKVEERKRGQHLRAEERGAELQDTPAEVANPATQPNVELQSTKQITVAAIALERYSGTPISSVGWSKRFVSIIRPLMRS
ncbi:MAG: hypothetical protein ACFWUM_01960 [Eubacteriales bacterium]|jgi:hypothetical protein